MTIKEACERSGLSTAELARRLKMPYRTLQNYALDIRQCPEWAERLLIKEINNMSESRAK